MTTKERKSRGFCVEGATKYSMVLPGGKQKCSLLVLALEPGSCRVETIFFSSLLFFLWIADHRLVAFAFVYFGSFSVKQGGARLPMHVCQKQERHPLLWLAVLAEAPAGRRFMLCSLHSSLAALLLLPWIEWGQSKTQSPRSKIQSVTLLPLVATFHCPFAFSFPNPPV